MNKHTPGPWVVNKEDFLDVYAPNDGAYTVATVAVTTDDEDEANSKLIAAAPDMAEALADIVNNAPGKRHPDWLARGRAALLKAGVS